MATAALLAVACGGPAAGLTQDQAVAAARPAARGMSTTAVSFVSAQSGTFDEFEPQVGTSASDPNRLVWAVVFRGTFHGSCGGAVATPRTCPSPNTSVLVVIDYRSGAFITALTPASGP